MRSNIWLARATKDRGQNQRRFQVVGDETLGRTLASAAQIAEAGLTEGEELTALEYFTTVDTDQPVGQRLSQEL